jgi:hypothetical protein
MLDTSRYPLEIYRIEQLLALEGGNKHSASSRLQYVLLKMESAVMYALTTLKDA